MKILFIGLASRLHGEDYYLKLYRGIVDKLSIYRDIVFYEKPLTETSETVLEEHDLLVLLHLTGGTSSLGYKLLRKYGGPVLLVAGGEHNALASALSLRSKLLDNSVKVMLLHYTSLDDLVNRFEVFYRGVSTGYSLEKLRILEVNREGVLSSSGKQYMEDVGGVVEAISYREVLSEADRVSSREVGEVLGIVKKYFVLNSIDENYLERVIKIYLGLKHIIASKDFEAVSIDCFPMIMDYRVTPCLAVALLNMEGVATACEMDYYSLPLLYVSYRLTGLPGWIANPSGIVGEKYLRFAHCTIAPSLGEKCRFIDHFETSNPYAVTCSYRFREVLFTRFDRRYGLLRIYRGRVIESGLLEDNYCRTQLIIEPSIDPYSFIEEALGNHHVFIPYNDKLLDMIKYLAWWMNWRLETRL